MDMCNLIEILYKYGYILNINCVFINMYNIIGWRTKGKNRYVVRKIGYID